MFNCFKFSTKKYCCLDCRNKSLRKTKRPTKQELEILIWKYPFTKIGKIYNVSDNTIRNWAKSLGIVNFPSRGYFLSKK